MMGLEKILLSFDMVDFGQKEAEQNRFHGLDDCGVVGFWWKHVLYFSHSFRSVLLCC